VYGRSRLAYPAGARTFMSRVRRALTPTLALAAASCRLPVDTHGDRPLSPGQPGYAESLQVKYLGVAGFLIQRGDDVVLTAPLYSNPDLLQEALSPIRPRLTRIDRFHPPTPPVDAVVVGHAHYDHLMDVPYVWERSGRPTIFGSSTMKNILAAYTGQAAPGFPAPVPVLPPDKVVALDDPARYAVDARLCAGTPPSQGGAGSGCGLWPMKTGEWVSVTPTLRIRALCARHPPQVPGGIHQGPGCVGAPRATLPQRADDYLEGPPLTYLIDFLDGQGAPAFRVYFQDVPTDGRLGQVPDELIAERPVDVALLCVGTWNLVEHGDAHRIVRNLRPQHVMLGHWEDFFRDQSGRPSPAPLQPVEEYHRLVKKELDRLRCPRPPTLSLPAPQLQKVYSPQPASCALR
jgi:L-ascorbate metabolism protein UlaG (beta-lactamase superfamily)